MKKNLFTIGFLALTFSLGAQQVVCHVDEGGIFFVGKNALVYNGGGLQMKGDAIYENQGNVMVVGNGTTDVFKTITAGNVDKTESNAGGNFVNKLNEPGAYASNNSTDPLVAPVYTYGQLYITGIPQANITGIVDQEVRQANQGDYQQIGMPFYGKSFSTLSSELAKTFNTTRRSKNEILVWNNRKVLFDDLASLNLQIGQNFSPFAYYALGGQALDINSTTRTLKGRPVSDFDNVAKIIQLQDAGKDINFGIGGIGTNELGERYNSYLQDNWSVSGGQAWQGDFGRNMYQFGNPYLTNLDLSQIAVNELNGDGNFLSNIYGVRIESQGVVYNNNPNGGGGSTKFKSVTFPGGVAVGDVDYLMVRPFGSFVVKLNNNIAQPALDFSNLRRFNYHPRSSSTGYDVTASRNVGNTTVKQLGIIGLDENGNELERTYFVVSKNMITGASTNVTAQVGAVSAMLGTFEEDFNGGYDNNNISYWLYINEANEDDFKGKNIKLVNYNPAIVNFKFEVRENAVLVNNGVHTLSQGIGFYYKKENEDAAQPVAQNAVTSQTGFGANGIYDFYYGEPETVVLGTNDAKKSSTIVVYNPEKDNYFVMIDPSWNTADIQVYDLSGKIVHNAGKVSSKVRYELPLQRNHSAGYIVRITSEKGEVSTMKILR